MVGTIHGTTDGMILGSTDGTIHGTMAAIGEDGTIHSITGDTGDGAAHGTTEATGAHTIHGIHTTSEAGILTMDSTEVLESATEDTYLPTVHMYQDMRQKETPVYSPATDVRL